MRDDVKAAIESNWNFDERLSTGSSVEGIRLPTSHDSDVDRESGDLAITELPQSSFLDPSASFRSLSTKSRFQPLLLEPSLASIDQIRAAENNSSEGQARKADSHCTAPEEEGFTLAPQTYSPTPHEDATMNSSNMKSKPAVPNRPGTPRVAEGLSASNNGMDLLHGLLEKASPSQSSRYSAEYRPLDRIKELRQPVICMDNEAHLVGKHTPREALTPDRHKHTDRLIQGPQKPAQDTVIFNLRPGDNANCSRSSCGTLRASPDNRDALFNAKTPEKTIIGLRRNPSTRAVDDILGTHTSDIKRQSQSLFGLEEDATNSLPREGKKAKFGDARHTSMDAEKILDQTDYTEPLYLPRI
jgi:hypothetical protein